jgi:PhnB protein
MKKTQIPTAPEGNKTVNPFIVTKDASQCMQFLKDVFNATENNEALAYDIDGLIIHSELKIGDSIVMVADRKKDWPFTPSLLQVYVDDIVSTLKEAEKKGARVVTKPTDFYGMVLARFVDPWDNVWWLWQYHPTKKGDWEDEPDGDSVSSEPSEEAQYIRNSLIETMQKLGK